jgi:hypothetical protein
MLRVALGAFIVGVFLHVCVLYAVLGDGGGSDKSTDIAFPCAFGRRTANDHPYALRPADRTSCDAIRGTDYRSKLKGAGSSATAPSAVE